MYSIHYLGYRYILVGVLKFLANQPPVYLLMDKDKKITTAYENELSEIDSNFGIINYTFQKQNNSVMIISKQHRRLRDMTYKVELLDKSNMWSRLNKKYIDEVLDNVREDTEKDEDMQKFMGRLK